MDIVYFYLETQRTANDAGGWDKKSAMGMTVGATYSTGACRYAVYGDDRVHELVEQLPRRGMVIIISDFFYDMSSIIQAMKHFRHDGHEVLAIQVLDPREKDFSFGLDANFRDIETGEELITQPYHIKKAYADGFALFMS